MTRPPTEAASHFHDVLIAFLELGLRSSVQEYQAQVVSRSPDHSTSTAHAAVGGEIKVELVRYDVGVIAAQLRTGVRHVANDVLGWWIVGAGIKPARAVKYPPLLSSPLFGHALNQRVKEAPARAAAFGASLVKVGAQTQTQRKQPTVLPFPIR